MVSGSFVVTRPNGSTVGTFSFSGNNGLFMVGDYQALVATQPSVRALGLSDPNQKIITFEDTDGSVDYNDDYWKVTVTTEDIKREHNGGCDCPGCCGDTAAKSKPAPQAAAGPAASRYPVGYTEGTPHFTVTDLASTGFTGGWSITRNYTTDSEYVPDNSFGYGWMNNRQMEIRSLGGDSGDPNLAVVNTAYTQIEFDYNTSTGAYQPAAVSDDTLTRNGLAKTYAWTDASDGTTNVFYGFDNANTALQGE